MTSKQAEVSFEPRSLMVVKVRKFGYVLSVTMIPNNLHGESEKDQDNKTS